MGVRGGEGAHAIQRKMACSCDDQRPYSKLLMRIATNLINNSIFQFEMRNEMRISRAKQKYAAKFETNLIIRCVECYCNIT